MDFKSMLNQLSQLSEATKETPTGREHKAEPGGYGRKFDTDEEGDEKQEKKAEGPKKRGRPAKTGEHSAEEKKKAAAREKSGKELQSYIVGNKPKDFEKKKGTVVKGKAQSGDKGDKKKKSVKEWVQEIEGKYIAEAGLTPTQTIVPGFQAGGKVAQPTVIDVKNPALKAALDKAAKDKQVTAVGIPQTTSTTPSPSGSTGQAPVGTAQVQEKWAGDAKVKATGEYAGKSVAELKSMLAKLHKSGPHKRGSEEEKKMHQINFALRAKGHWKKGEGAALKEVEPPTMDNMSAMGAGLGAARNPDVLEAQFKKQYRKVLESKGIKVTDQMLEEGWKQKLAAAGLAGTMALGSLGAGAAHATPQQGLGEPTSATQQQTQDIWQPAFQRAYSLYYSTKNPELKKEIDNADQFHRDQSHGIRLMVAQNKNLAPKAAQDQKQLDLKFKNNLEKILQRYQAMEGGVMEGKKSALLDLDKDGNKKKVDESMDHRLKAAHHMGKSHALARESYSCKYDDMDEARCYHEGFKEGLDECYGQMPIVGLVKETPAATVPGMAQQAMPTMEDGVAEGNMKESMLPFTPKIRKNIIKLYLQGLEDDEIASHLGIDVDGVTEVVNDYEWVADTTGEMPWRGEDMEEGNAFTAALAKTPKGGKFSVGGKTFTDRTNYDSKLDEFAFESWDKELNALLTESEQVDEGMTVSISKGQQGAPDSVSVTAQDGEADQLLGLIKQAGLGLFGDKEPSGYGAPEGSSQAHGDINVVGDHDGMMALIKKVAGGEAPSSDYKDEEGEEHHDHDHADEEECSECGYMESDCKCEKEMVDEVESEDQMTYEVAEDNAPDSDEAETSADENAEAAEDAALAAADQQNKTATVNEWANAVGKGPGKGTDASFEQDIEFMTKVISGGLNKPKSTGQTTIPVIAGQDTRMEDPMAWAKLAGIKK